MLNYFRNKLVSVDKIEKDALIIHGILDDDMYGLEIEAAFTIKTLEITSIKGKWYRWTTPECRRAVEQLGAAVGLTVGPGFRATVQKTVGRGACRHFANLLVEMGHAAKTAVHLMGHDVDTIAPATLKNEDLNKVTAKTAPPYLPEVKKYTSGKNAENCVIDLHVHTMPASPCSSIKVDDLIVEAKTTGLNGIVLTDHNHLWRKDELDALQQKHAFLVLGGNEIITDQGDVLVFGFDKKVDGLIKLSDLRKEVKNVGGYMVMAHPFRGFLIVDASQLGLTVEKAAEREIFKMVDNIEVLNGKVAPIENDFARQVATVLDFSGTGGSDAHETGSVGGCATEFLRPIKNDRDFLEALHDGAFQVVKAME